MSNQLVKKNPAEGYQNVFPKTWIDAIKDKESGVSLQEILQGFNMYFLSYNGSRALTRCKVPSILRKEGLWITYVLYDHTVVTEWYNSDQIDDNSWSIDSNWRVASNALVGDVSVSADGYWVINGEKTEAKAQGEQGVTPLLRVGANNKLQVSYNAGKAWKDISDYIVPRFKWNQGVGTTAGTIQISMDLGKTWTNLSNEITNNLRISRYIGINESLPTSGIAEGTIYMKGPYYGEGDTSNANPIYRMWVYAWKDNTLAWQDNGEFTSISAGVVQERGNSTTEVMSQNAITRELTGLESEVSMSIYDSRIQTSNTNPLYENTIEEVYLFQDYLKDIDYVDFRDYTTRIYMYAFRGTIDHNANIIWSVTDVILSDKSNGQVIPLKCTSAGGNVSVGDIVGYVVFKDIDTFKSINTGNLGNVLNLANVTRLYRQPKISNYLFGLDELGDNVKKLSDDTKKLSNDTKKLSDDTKKLSDDVKKLKLEVNGEINFVDSFSMIGDGSKYHQKNVSTIDISNYAGKEIVISLGSVSSSESTINSCIVGYVQTSSGESLNNTGIIKAGNSAKILLPSNAGKILIQAFPAYNGTGIPDVNGATYTFEDIRTSVHLSIEGRVEDLNVRVESLNTRVESLEGNTKEIQIPSTIFAVVGTELNIWNDTVSYSIDRGIVSPLNYAISWKSYVGIVTDRGFHFTPLPEHAGNTYALLCIMYNGKTEVARKTISIVVKANNSLNSQKNIIFFGDSTGASSATALYNVLHNSERFTGIIPTMLGSRGTNTIRYEAFGGARWVDFATAGRAAFRCYVTNAPTIPLNARYTNNGFTWQVVEVNITDGVGNILITMDSTTYTDTPEPNGTLVSITSGVQDITYNSYENAPANPLWDSTQNALSISHYKDVLGISQSTKFDAVFFQLGLNHSDLGENFENLVGYITALYNLFVNDNPNCIVILGLTTTAGNTQDGGGVNYGASIPPITHNIRMYNLRNEYIKLINGGTMPNLRIAPTNNNVDRYYGYDFSQRTVNYTIGGVSKSETIMYHNNMVHPGPIGYRQMGDAYFNALIGSLIIVA